MHDSEISPDDTSSITSAKAIRQDLQVNSGKISGRYIPDSTRNLLNPNGSYIKNNDFSDILFYKLGKIIYMNDKNTAIGILSSYSDVTEDLAGRIYNLFGKVTTYDDFAAALWSKNYTYARIDRVLYHIIGEITKELIESNKAFDFCPYIRPLAIKRESSVILNEVGKAVKNSEKVELISRIGDANKLQNKAAIDTFNVTRFMTALYNQITYKNYGIKTYDEASESFIYFSS